MEEQVQSEVYQIIMNDVITKIINLWPSFEME
jgi:hypothetical protein